MMSLQDDIEDGVDAIIAQRDAARRRLGQYQALGVDWLECYGNPEAMAECRMAVAEMLREDLSPHVPSGPTVEQMERAAAEASARALQSDRRAAELQAANDALREQVRDLFARLQAVEMHGPVTFGAMSNGHGGEAKPDQNQTETIPAAPPPVKQKRRLGMSDEQRAAASERMKAMRAAQKAAKGQQNGHAPTPEADPAPEPESFNGTLTLSGRMDACRTEMEGVERRGEPFTQQVLSDLARRHDLSMYAVEQLLGSFPVAGTASA